MRTKADIADAARAIRASWRWRWSPAEIAPCEDQQTLGVDAPLRGILQRDQLAVGADVDLART
jgi:hypothetical protein